MTVDKAQKDYEDKTGDHQSSNHDRNRDEVIWEAGGEQTEKDVIEAKRSVTVKE